jgi:uncharacterized membrane protein
VGLEWVIWVIAAILAVAALEVTVLVFYVRRRRRRNSTAHTPAVSVGPRRSPWPILAVVFLSIGLVFALVVGISTAVVAESISGDRYADGTIVDLDYNGRSYSPVVEFSVPSGAPIRFTSSIGSNPPSAQVGEHVGVRYTPNNPQDAVIDQYWQIWFFPTLLGIIGTPFLLFGIAFGSVALAHRRRSRAQPGALKTGPQG